MTSGGQPGLLRPGAHGSGIRVLLVDDSAVVRRIVSRVLEGEPGIEVAGVAGDGRQALGLVEACQPHVVVLDVEMPVLDGVGTVRELRPRWPLLPVIMFSTLTERGAAATLDALAAGASDYATKPAAGSLHGSLGVLRESLVPLVRSWGMIGRRREGRGVIGALRGAPGRPVGAGGEPRGPVATEGAASGGTWTRPPRPRRIDAVVIGCSTGGPNALGQLVPALPGDLGVPVVVVQHMPEAFTALLAQRLDRGAALRVMESAPGMAVEAGGLYIARGGSHLLVQREGPRVALAHGDGPPVNSCRPAVDVLLQSAVRVWGGGVLAVLLTGMGQDGLEGARAVVDAGGTVIAQDEASSVVWGMPGAVVGAGLSSECLPLDEIAVSISRRIAPNRKASG